MFTGLVEEIGTVEAVRRRDGALWMRIAAREVLSDLEVDDSIAVQGVCLTAVAVGDDGFEVEAVEETLRKSTLGSLKKDSTVNLERSLRPTDRLGGHFVQGHVDGVGAVVVARPQAGGKLISVELPEPLTKYVIAKGSIALDGVSLTVAEKIDRRVTISFIPHTLARTTFGACRLGDRVNVEVDLIGKYIETLLPGAREGGLTQAWLTNLGYE